MPLHQEIQLSSKICKMKSKSIILWGDLKEINFAKFVRVSCLEARNHATIVEIGLPGQTTIEKGSMNKRCLKGFVAHVAINLVKQMKNFAYFISLNVFNAISYRLKIRDKGVRSA